MCIKTNEIGDAYLICFGTPSGVYAYRQKAIRRSAAALRSGLDPVATKQSAGLFRFTFRPLQKGGSSHAAHECNMKCNKTHSKAKAIVLQKKP